jgi:hypothetical protein
MLGYQPLLGAGSTVETFLIPKINDENRLFSSQSQVEIDKISTWLTA